MVDNFSTAKIAKDYDSVSSLDLEEDRIAKAVFEAGLEVHKKLGPGLLESCYESCLAKELDLRNINYARQKAISIQYKGLLVDQAFRADLILENKMILEIKSCEQITNLHSAQLMTYMKLLDVRIGFIMNFNTPLFKNGVKRLVLRRS